MPARTRADRSSTGRWRWESNPRTGLCRPLPEPLGYATGNGRGYPAGVRGARSSVRAVGGHAERAGRVAAACLVATLGVAVMASGGRRRPGAARAAAARRAPSGVRLADVGLFARPDVRDPVPDARSLDDGRPHLRLRWFTPTHDVVTATPGARARHPLRRRLVRAGHGALGRDRAAPLDVPGADPPAGLQRPDRRVRPRSRRPRRRARCSFRPATRCSPSVPATARVRWSYRIGRRVRGNSSEIESSPVVVDGMVIFGWDVHNEPKGGRPAGVVALDARTGSRALAHRHRAGATPDRTRPAPGCGDVWGSPAVDRARRLVIVGTGNCVVASGMGSGQRCAARVRPRRRSRALDLPAASAEPGRPRLRRRAQPLRRSTVARSSASATRTASTTSSTGRRARRSRPSTPPRPGSRSRAATSPPAASSVPRPTPTAWWSAAPRSDRRRTSTASTSAPGASRGRTAEPAATYAATAIAGGVAFVGGTDFTLRAVRVSDGTVLWSHPMKGAVSGGAVVDRHRVYAVAGIREPGTARAAAPAACTRSRCAARPSASGSRSHRPRARPPRAAGAAPRDCVGAPCALTFTLRRPARRTHADRHARDHRVAVPPPRDDVGARRPGQWVRAGQRGGQGRRDRLRGLHVRVGRQPDRRPRLRARAPTARAPDAASPGPAPPTTASRSSRSTATRCPASSTASTASSPPRPSPHRSHPGTRSPPCVES